MKKLLESVVEALNQIQVSGKENLNLLLGCILTLEKLSEACKTKAEEKMLEGVVPDDGCSEGKNLCGENDRAAGSPE